MDPRLVFIIRHQFFGKKTREKEREKSRNGREKEKRKGIEKE